MKINSICIKKYKQKKIFWIFLDEDRIDDEISLF